jgi:hypothetical protein
MPITNTTALTAMVIPSLPFSVTQDVSAETSSLELWYTYTATATDRVVGVVPYADIGSVYLPRLTIYTGPASSPVLYHVNNSLQRAAYVPVTEGTVYLWKVTQGGGGTPLGTSLIFKAVSGSLDTAPANSLLTTEENSGFPASVLSGDTDNTVYFQVPDFPRGVMGVTLNTGTLIVDTDAEQVAIYNNALTQTFLGQPYYPFTPKWMSSNTETKFYLPYNPSFTVTPIDLRTLTPSGALTSDQWTLPANSASAVAGAPSRDDNIFYYGNTAIHRWDLVNSIALSDLVAAIASHSLLEILVLGDGSILASYRQGNTECIVKNYDTSGTTLQTYTFTGLEVHHIALAYDDPATFWVWLEDALGAPVTATFRRIKISDGSTVNEANYTLFAGGPSRVSYDPTYATVDDVPLFGPPPTCTFFVLTASVSPVTPTPTPIPPAEQGPDDPIRRLRRAPHLWDGANGHRLTYQGFQLLVESGSPRDTNAPLTFFLQWSDDGGHTWSNLHELSGSKIGQYKTRFWWQRLGQSRDRVFQVINSDSAKIVLIDALLTPDPVEGSS